MNSGVYILEGNLFFGSFEHLSCWCSQNGITNKSSAVAEIGDCLAKIDFGRKGGGFSATFMGELCSRLMSPGLRPTSLPSGILIYPVVWPQQTWAENWGAVPVLGRGSWVAF